MPHALRRFFSDRHGRIVVAQWPNAPLLAWAGLSVASHASRGGWSGYFGLFATAALVTWAWLEISQGDSPFRRVLGGVVLAWLVVSRLP